MCYFPFIYRFSHEITSLFPLPHLQAQSPHKSFTWDTGPMMNHRQRSHLRLTSTFKLGWNCLQWRYVWEFSLSLISMEMRCRAEPHPTGVVGFDLYKYALFLYLRFFGSAHRQHWIISAHLLPFWHLCGYTPLKTGPPSSLWGKIRSFFLTLTTHRPSRPAVWNRDFSTRVFSGWVGSSPPQKGWRSGNRYLRAWGCASEPKVGT